MPLKLLLCSGMKVNQYGRSSTQSACREEGEEDDTSHRGCSEKLVVRNKLCSDPPEDLERSQHGGQDVAHRVDLGHCDQRNLDRPSKTQDHIFHNRAVVVGLDTEQTGLVSVWVGRARRLNQTNETVSAPSEQRRNFSIITFTTRGSPPATSRPALID
uniref:Uncharacterized protein n=1 Tax=Neolamprologus brichardi TaxID=32507 RepID=A0A3Q4MTD7_NEOBR